MSKLSSLPSYRRPLADVLEARLAEPRRFLQVVAGPRQAGKTTLVRQVLSTSSIPYRYATADEPSLRGRVWLEEQWDLARQLASEAQQDEAILVLDEIQKITGWSEAVKRLWDEDTASGHSLKVVLLGSSPLLLQEGLTESLAGRFEILHATHWLFAEMQGAFGWPVETYVFYGGYPGAAPLIDDHDRWARYILDSLIETTISRDVLLMTRVLKPALLRRLFDLATTYSGQVLSYTKMLGQLQEAGNTTTLAHYLQLLEGAGMVLGLPKYSGSVVRRRGSIPKLQVMNTALMTAPSGRTPETAKDDPRFWGRLVESAVGAHLVNAQLRGDCKVYYWRTGDREVDFVLEDRRGRIAAIEVKSGPRAAPPRGMEAFDRAHHPRRKLLVGADGIPLQTFLHAPVLQWTA